MRKRIILSLISIFAFVFFSCSGLLNDVDENSSSNKAYVQIGDTSSRTVLPAALDTGNMTDIKLIGVKDGGSSKDLLSATTYEELTGKTAEIEPGTWSFELQATINGNTFTDSTSCTNKEVSAGDTLRLTFSAMEAGEEGNFSVKVNYEGEVPSSVKVFLDDEDWTSYMFSEPESYVIVTGSASSGDHKLKIEFYDGNSLLLNTFREIIRVKGGLLSEREYPITLSPSPLKLQSEKLRNALEVLNIKEATAFKPSTIAPDPDEISTAPLLLNEDGAEAWNDNGTIYYYNPSSTKISLGSDAYYLFGNCSAITEIDMSGFDTSNVRSMSEMFYGCVALTKLDLSNFDTSNVRSMHAMFYNCSALTELDLSNFDTSKVTNMGNMFYGCAALETIYTAPDADWSSVSEKSYHMFEGCTKLVGGKGTVYDSNHDNATYAHVDSDDNPGYFTEVGTEKTYRISVNTIVGGTVEASATSATAGTVITLTPDAKNTGYAFNNVWDVRDASGATVIVIDNKFTMPDSNVTVSATFTVTSITAALAEGAELTITFVTESYNNTVTFTRQTDGSYITSNVDGYYPAHARASEKDGIITIDVTSGADYNDSAIMFTLDIYTNDSKYAEYIGHYMSPALQTIKVNGTLVTLTPKTSD